MRVTVAQIVVFSATEYGENVEVIQLHLYREQIVAVPMPQIMGNLGGDSACDADCGPVPQIMKEIMEVCSWIAVYIGGDFLEPSMTHNCESSRCGGVAGSFTPR